MANKLRNFVIFGAAGSGKGTIASKIVNDFTFKHVSLHYSCTACLVDLSPLMFVSALCSTDLER